MTSKCKFCVARGCIHNGMCPPYEARTTGSHGLREAYADACEYITQLEEEVKQLTEARTLLQAVLGFGDDTAKVVDGIKLLISMNDIDKQNRKDFVSHWVDQQMAELATFSKALKLDKASKLSEQD